jgi:cell division protein FtsB
MELDKSFLIFMVVLICTVGWLVNNWIRAKYGYALEDSWGRKVEPGNTAEAQRLKAENKALHDKLDTMQDRMIVLEKIVTDRGYSLADEIEALRDTRRSDDTTGAPLNLGKQERV